MNLRSLIWSFIFVMMSFNILAQDIKLTADDKVEYHQKEQKLVAVGNAKASKGDMSIHANTLIGYYAPKNPNKISKVEAHQNVVMTANQTEAFGDSMIYDVKADTAVLSGKPARIKTPDAEITSLGPITFYQTAMKAYSQGDVTAVDNKGNRVRADEMTAYFTKNAQGKMILDKIDIAGNVKITSPNGDISAHSGTYYATINVIKLFDDIIITQNGNILKGSRAETDLNSGISRILAGDKARVSGVFKETKKPHK